MHNATPGTSRIFFFLTIAALIPAAGASTATSLHPVVLPFHAYGDTPLKTVQVALGTKPIPFLFDTGGGLTVITPAAAKTLDCTPFGRVVGFRANGEKVSYPRCGPVTLHLGDYEATGEVGVFDLMGMMRSQVEKARKAGHTVSMPPTVGGLIGLSSFAGRAVTFDYAHGRVIVETPASLRQRTASMRPLTVRVATEADGSKVVFVQAKAETGTLWLELDSGNNGSTYLAPQAIKQLGITLPKGEKASVQLQLAGFGEVPVVARRRTMIYDGQLGIGMISKFVWTIDLKTSRAWIKPEKQKYSDVAPKGSKTGRMMGQG